MPSYGNEERQSLAASGLGCTQQVEAFQSDSNRFALNLGRFDIVGAF